MPNCPHCSELQAKLAEAERERELEAVKATRDQFYRQFMEVKEAAVAQMQRADSAESRLAAAEGEALRLCHENESLRDSIQAAIGSISTWTKDGKLTLASLNILTDALKRELPRARAARKEE